MLKVPLWFSSSLSYDASMAFITGLIRVINICQVASNKIVRGGLLTAVRPLGTAPIKWRC